jgi:hypothetical protein
MSTYFGYVEREADNYINWAEVSKDITTTFNDINRVREEKKQALDDALRQDLKTIALQPKGKDEEANRFMTDYGDNASNFLLMQNRLLKAGKIKLKDYVNASQNISDSTDNLFKAMEDYNKNYAVHMERYQKEISSGAEPYLLSLAEGFADFGQVGSFIDTDGSVKLARRSLTKVDGKDVYKIDTSPGNMKSISVIRDAVNQQIDRFDAGKATTELADATGKEVRVLNQGGITITTEGIRFRGEQIYDDPLIDETSTEKALMNITNAKKQTIKFKDAKGVETDIIGKEGEIAKLYHQAKDKDDASRTEQEKRAMSIVLGNVSKTVREGANKAVIDFEEAETKLIRAKLANDNNYQSVLFDNMKIASNGKEFQYGIAENKEEAIKLAKQNPNIIYYAVQGGTLKPALSDDQKLEAEEFMRGQLRLKYDQAYKEEEKAVGRYTSTGESGGGRRYGGGAANAKKQAEIEEDIYEATFAANLYNGTDEEIQTAIDHYAGKDYIHTIRRTEDGVYIQMQDPETQQPVGDEEFFSFWAGEKGKGTDNFVKSIVPKLYGDGFNTNIALSNIQNKSLMPNLDLFTEEELMDIEGSTEGETGAKTEIAALGALGGGLSDKENPRAVKISRYRRANKQAGGVGSKYND